MIRFVSSIFCFIALLVLCACQPQKDPNVIRLAVTDVEGLEDLQTQYDPFKDLMEEKTGYTVKYYPVASRAAAIEAMRAERLDFAFTGPSEYTMLRSQIRVEPIVGMSRPGYFSQIITLKDSGIEDIKELKGKKIALGTVGSTSTHLGQVLIFDSIGMSLDDMEVVHLNRQVAWEALKRGDIVACGYGSTSLPMVLAADPSVPREHIVTLATGEELPNDVLVAAEHVDPAKKAGMRAFFTEHADAIRNCLKQGDEAFGRDRDLYLNMVFLTDVSDSDYDRMRTAFRLVGQDQFAQIYSGNE